MQSDQWTGACAGYIKEMEDFYVAPLKLPCNCKGGGGSKPGWKPPLGRPGACDPRIQGELYGDKRNSLKQTYGRVPYLKSVYDPPGGKEGCKGSPHDICTLNVHCCWFRPVHHDDIEKQEECKGCPGSGNHASAVDWSPPEVGWTGKNYLGIDT